MEKHSEKVDTNNISLVEYYSIGKKILYSLLGKGAKSIIEDQERFGTVVAEIMIADSKWNGIGTLYGYRKQRVKWILNKVFKKRPKEVSLYKNLTEELYLLDIIEDVKANTVYSVDKQDDIKYVLSIMDSVKLTKNEKVCIEKYYLDGFKTTMQKVGEDIGMTKQAVSINIESGVRKIKEYISTNPIGV